MGAASSKGFVNQMLRNSVDEANDIFAISGDNARLDSYEQEFLHAQLEDYENDEDDARTNLLLSLVVLHANVQCLKKKKLLMLKAAELRRRQGARLALSDKKTRIAHPRYFTDPITGVRCRMTPKLSLWWVLYIQDPKPECGRWSKSFRQRFRMPYHSFIKILNMMREDDNDVYFRRWKSVTQQEEDQESNACQQVPPRKVSPIELLLLGTLRYLGRGWTFDDLEESTFISRDVHRCFFHYYCAFGAQKLYPLNIKMPNTLQDLRACEKEYRDAGFPGCIGSTDATHIPLERVSCGIRQGHLGYKMSCTARTYNLTVNHRRQILHSTTGHPGRWNDKTLIRFDSFMTELQKGALNSTMSFELRKQHSVIAEGEAAPPATTTIKGAYVIVDNGYLDWSTTVPPMKNTCNRSEIRFSQWLESLRKDVECTFGILKGRWRVLKSGIRVHNTESADNMWLTCCAMHNMLLDVDGLSVGWQNGVPSHWELQSGQFQDDDIPDAIRRLLSTEQVIRTYDRSSCGRRHNPASAAPFRNEEVDNGQRSILNQRIIAEGEAVAVNELPLSQFRAMLIDNFNVLFHEQKIAWPKRLTGSMPRHVPDHT